MPIEIRKNNIANIRADALVNPTDHFLSGFNSIDREIHRAAGPALDLECEKTFYLNSGSAVITNAYGLTNYRNIIHICGPDYTGGGHEEELLLESCYEECLKLAKENQLESVAVPVYDSGTFGFTTGQVIRIATRVISDFLAENDMTVYLLVNDREFIDSRDDLYADINSYLESKIRKVDTESSSKPKHKNKAKEDHLSLISDKIQGLQGNIKETVLYEDEEQYDLFDEEAAEIVTDEKAESKPHYYAEALDLPKFEPDESFSECLIRMIDEKGMNDPQVYKRANIDRKHFNHIKNTKDYKPKKETVVALAVGMELGMKDTDALLEKAGFVLSKSSKFDLIIRYCIEHNIYDIYRINEILFAEDQKTLGC